MSDWLSISSGVRQGCKIAPDLFLGTVDRVMERTVHRGMNVVTLGDASFTDFGFADDLALLAEMLEVLILALSMMHEEAAAFVLQINWSKTKIMQFSNPHPCSTVQAADGLVEVANSFVNL